MGKVVITRNQAERIQEWKYNRGILLGFHARNNLSDHSCLRSLTLDELARCLYAEEGYEVKEEFKLGEWVVVTFKLHTTIYGKTKKITDVNKSCSAGDDIYFELDGKGVVYQNEIRHATESEIAEEEKRRTNKKLDEILLDLSDDERDRLYERLEWGDY